MRPNCTWVHRMLRTFAILACILLPALPVIAAEPSCNEHLLLAAENGSGEQAKTLPARGGDVNAKDGDGDTALRLASARNQTKTVQYLKAHGAK